MSNKWVLPLLIILMIGLGFLAKTFFSESHFQDPIKVGVIHSLTGTMSISELPVVDATLMAIDEINQNGGVLNRQIKPIIVDGQSSDEQFAKQTEKLIVEDKVDAIFGCWTSACRKSIVPIIEKYHSLFVYPVQYEGLEQSPNVIYTGAAPNQQIIPAINWSFEHLGKRFFLVGSDYVFPHTANAIIKDQVKTLAGSVVGEEYLMLGSTDVEGVIKKIQESKPDVIINTLNGDTNVAFFKALKKAGIEADKIPTMSFSITENEVKIMGPELLKGHYAAWNYFQSIDSKNNQRFVEDFKNKFGSDRTTSDPMEAAYFGVYLWVQGVKGANSPAPENVLNAIKNQSFAAPEGVVSVDAVTNHTWKTLRIGQIKENGQFEILWSTENPIEPVPYPSYRTKVDWDKFLQNLYVHWGNKWSNSPNSPINQQKSSLEQVKDESK